ncbi:MAG: hypothetical protein CO035_00535 [Candidatus Omnitrophica bacterium CG_4_9_14_0_2_um_filter_42_8]|nr:MAG: hypothetical protein COW92_03415 [Candidatus Omnitrophica bacterium CG22_combo_CG10-13_8_21_14_all_43_16]PJC48998.1 MAG: hypothetical protein CO035_00535 [Candidatus Omnitrophica bacterium CG_4_9_14_0_2_um_filter_42_8]
MKYKVIFILLSIFYISLTGNKGYAQEEERSVFASKFCTIFYENDVDLKKVSRRLNLGFSNFYSPRNYKESPGISIQDIIADKFDAIFNRTEEILDMYPARIHVTINIYKTQEELNKIYEEFFNEPNNAVSFYIYKTNTIYTIESKLTENILAHEMAHCIIDHYFVMLPPRKIQEMLAVYVDVHLKD